MKSLLTKIISVLTIFALCASLCACGTTPLSNNEPENCDNGHNLVQSSYTAPTCKTNGEEVYKCSRCGFENKKTILTIACDFQVKSTTPSTCTTRGSEMLECVMCHETKTTTFELLNHDYKLSDESSSTCTIKGYKTYKCTLCNGEYSNELPLLNHDYELLTVVHSTCIVKGSKEYKCKDCNDSYLEELQLLNHNYELKNTTPSTCTIKGSKDYECSVCHATYSDELPLEEHKYSNTTVEEPVATCFTKGEKVKKCEECGNSLKQDETEMLTHSFGVDGYCTKCGIYKTLFDEYALNIKWQVNPILISVSGDLTAKFNNEPNTISNSYWKDHTVEIRITLIDKNESIINNSSFTSSTLESGELVIEHMGFTLANRFFIVLNQFDIFSYDELTNCRSFKIEISCEGYKTIEKTYDITKAH